MTSRRPGTPTPSKQLDILFARRMVICVECGEVIERRQDCEFDHRTEWADAQDNSVENYGPVHNKVSGGCHKRKSAKAERDRHHIDRLAKLRTEPSSLKQTVNPGERCHRCGEYLPCPCQKQVRRPAFRRR